MRVVKATISHGQNRFSLSVAGASIEDCLMQLSRNSYCVSESSPHFETVERELESSGKSTLGWVDYVVA